MWSLHNLETKKTVYMLSNENYKIGKLETHVPTSNKDGKEDASISRSHALFKIKHKKENLNKPDMLPEVTLRDTKSTYGTYINENIQVLRAMNKDHDFLMQSGTLIKFGKQWNHWQLKYEPLVVVTSTMSSRPSAEVTSNILKLGGHIVNSWRPEGTHLTMEHIKVTTKLVCAMAKGVPIVTPEFWNAWVSSVKESRECPKPEEFLPEVQESTLNKNEVNFHVNPERKNLFKGITFVAASEQQLARVECIIQAAGGVPVLLGSLSMAELSKDGVLVLQHSPQDSQGKDASLPAGYDKVLDKLKKLKKRVIPESELTLAVLYNSTETNCNPSFDHAKLIRSRRSTQNTEDSPPTILAPDTADTQVLPPRATRATRTHPEVSTAAKPQASKAKTTKTTESRQEESTSTRSTRASKAKASPSKETTFMVPESLEIKEELTPTRPTRANKAKASPNKETTFMVPESLEIKEELTPTRPTRASKAKASPSKDTTFMVPESLEVNDSTQVMTSRPTRASKSKASSSKDTTFMVAESLEVDDSTQVMSSRPTRASRANDTQEIPSKVIKKTSMVVPESMEIDDSPQASARATRVSKITPPPCKEGPIVKKTTKMMMSQSLDSSNESMSLPQSSSKPSLGSMLTFKDDDNIFSVPKATMNKRLGEPQPSSAQPSTKMQRLSAPEEDSQEVVVRRLKNATIMDDSEEENASDEDDPFGFEDRKSLPPSKSLNQASSSKTKPTGTKRTNDNDSDDNEEEVFKFKPIKLAKVVPRDDEEDIFDFDDVVTDLPASAAPTQQDRSKKNTPQKASQAPKETREPKTKQPPKNDTPVDPVPSTSSTRDEPVSQEDWLDTSNCKPDVKEENATLPSQQQERDSGGEDDEMEDNIPRGTNVVVVIFKPLVKPNTSVARETNRSANTSMNVKLFKKSWHPQLQQLPMVISRTELKNYSSLSGEPLPGVEETEQEKKREVENETAWAFKDAVTTTNTKRRGRKF